MAISDKDITKLKQTFATKKDLDRFAIKQDVELIKNDMLDKVEAMFTRFKSDIFDKIDPILKEVIASREERVLVSAKLSDHEDRLEKVEKQLGIAHTN